MLIGETLSLIFVDCNLQHTLCVHWSLFRPNCQYIIYQLSASAFLELFTSCKQLRLVAGGGGDGGGHYKDWIIYLTKASITALLTLHDTFWSVKCQSARL